MELINGSYFIVVVMSENKTALFIVVKQCIAFRRQVVFVLSHNLFPASASERSNLEDGTIEYADDYPLQTG